MKLHEVGMEALTINEIYKASEAELTERLTSSGFSIHFSEAPSYYMVSLCLTDPFWWASTSASDKLMALRSVACAAVYVLKERRTPYVDPLTCGHPEVVEEPYRDGGLGDPYYGGSRHTPPRRICLTCRISEEGWGSGYHILKNAQGREVFQRPRTEESYPRWSWCCGNSRLSAHPALSAEVLRNCRCKEHGGSNDPDWRL
jgi:hypothetical protein